MPRLIDAEHLKKRATDWFGDCWDNYAQSTEDFLEYIDNEPTVDAVEVVRCEDCKYWYTERQYCDRLSGVWEKEHTSPNDYCSWGERRKNEKDTYPIRENL